ncbi:MAG: hypothetical protein ACOYK6_07670 [Chthoniobacterales bacterium]
MNINPFRKSYQTPTDNPTNITENSPTGITEEKGPGLLDRFSKLKPFNMPLSFSANRESPSPQTTNSLSSEDTADKVSLQELEQTFVSHIEEISNDLPKVKSPEEMKHVFSMLSETLSDVKVMVEADPKTAPLKLTLFQQELNEAEERINKGRELLDSPPSRFKTEKSLSDDPDPKKVLGKIKVAAQTVRHIGEARTNAFTEIRKYAQEALEGLKRASGTYHSIIVHSEQPDFVYEEELDHLSTDRIDQLVKNGDYKRIGEW